MIPLYTREQMRAVDRAASESFGIPTLLLMESAGARATDHLQRRYPGQLGCVLIVGGEGQNGGDGWVVARHLAALGLTPRCVLVGDRERVRGDARVNFDALAALALAPIAFDASRLDELEAQLADASLIVDALFGTGLTRAIEGEHARVVQALGRASAPICSLDLPSGIDADTGQVLGVAVSAHTTVTFAGHKRGLHQFPGAAHAGTVECVSIGAPLGGEPRVGLIEPCDVVRRLTPAPEDAHKGTRGHVLAIAGSQGKTGAAQLAALGALRMGAGLVTIVSDEQTCRALDQKVIELMTFALDAHDPLASLLHFAEGKRAALLGPGFGLTPERRALASRLAAELALPCVLDADALTAMDGELERLQHARGPRILTPHPGEAARLLGRTVAEVQADRYAAARALAERSGQVAVLKGARTVIAAPDGDLRVCRAGTPALGVAGTGDVLSGVVATLLSQLAPFEAAWVGVELHAHAGELAATSDRGLLASELASALPSALERIRRAGNLFRTT
jgi:ADP-dependent NAD(P)H-hydrate dehydratase / NAD(P)H-hydrate epimerase